MSDIRTPTAQQTTAHPRTPQPKTPQPKTRQPETPQPETPQPEAAPPIAIPLPPHRAVAVMLFVACLFFLAFAADRVFVAGYFVPMLGAMWAPDPEPIAGGQWLITALYRLVRAIPRAGPELLVILTLVVVAAALGLFGGALRRRGWPAATAALATTLLAIHPVTLYLATTGQPVVLSLAAVAVVVLCVDRAGALGDAQSLMGLGLAFALLFVTEPNAIYLVLPALLVLPLTLDDMRDGGAAAALFLIVLIPAVIAIAAVLMGGLPFGVSPGAAIHHWLAILHGDLDEPRTASRWLARRGGTLFEPFGAILLTCAVCFPPLLLIVLRILPGRRRVRLGTGLLALFVGPLSGAVAVFFWHPEPWWNSLAFAIASAATWVTTVPLRGRERGAWLMLLAVGLGLAWLGPWLWDEPDKLAWRTGLLG